ncbi:MAG: ATP-dependent DNA helicase PcrA, partial [Proteobacteria bacterium]|nr:ATP-dependent DNA helicase PcrA [Pseudomonadota bacterium]
KIFGGLKFYARKEVKDLIALLKVIHNSGDEVSLIRVINVPKKGIGKSLIAKVREQASVRGCSFYEAIPEYLDSLKKKSKGAQGLSDFYNMIKRLRGTAQTVGLSLLMESVIEESGYVDMLQQENTVEARSRLENIKELLGAIDEFQDTLKWKEVDSELEAYLEFISLQAGIDNFYEEDQ